MPERLRREAGLIITSDRESDRPISEVMTVQCVHCGAHIRTDDMKYTGFCDQCDGFHCGDSCAVCVPMEQLLRNFEAGKPPDFRPIQSKANGGAYRGNFSRALGTK